MPSIKIEPIINAGLTSNIDFSKGNISFRWTLAGVNKLIIIIRNKTRSRSYTTDNLSDSKELIKNCLDDLIDQIVDEFELIYDNMPNLSLEKYTETFVPFDEKTNKFLFKFTANSIGLSKVIRNKK